MIKEAFAKDVADLKAAAAKAGEALDHTFEFCEQAFADGDEILIFVTELTVNYYSARFIGRYGCDRYFLHNKELQFHERRQELIGRVSNLDFDL